MIVRLTAAVLLSGLTFATPSHAELDTLSFEHFLDPQETETATLIAVDLAMLSSADAPAPGTELSDNGVIEQQPGPTLPAEVAGAVHLDQVVEQVLLAPELFLDCNENETLALIAAGIGSVEELATGSIADPSAGTASLPTERSIVHSLTDDALLFEEYLTP
jgi:hypothetical protein